MPSYVKWYPERLNARLLSAFRSSVGDAKKVALLASPTHDRRAGARYTFVGPTHATLGTTGALGHIFELGRHGGYVIQPGLKTTRSRVSGGSRFEKVTSGVRGGSGNIALKFTKGDGGFARGGIIGGAMSAKPYIRPTSVVWAHTLYQRRARAAMRGLIGF